MCIGHFIICSRENLPHCLESSLEGDSVYLIYQFYMQGIADTMGCLQREGRLLQGEHNLLGEAFLVMASSAG